MRRFTEKPSFRIVPVRHDDPDIRLEARPVAVVDCGYQGGHVKQGQRAQVADMIQPAARVPTVGPLHRIRDCFVDPFPHRQGHHPRRHH